ncbi:PqiB family protein [Thalassotalea hakodatensis]|uniref:PqiB family protein n=1 Tax=Thalassotalea hakodatensis TaxID=3030492 RepID=UPI002572B65B|nr:MlaD family protein [Thalassotalea hakodatensis]
MSNKQHHPLDAIISSKESVSAVWLVPIIALLFGAWLIVKAVYERGVYITVQFNQASGIVVGKTEVRYKGLPIGVVKQVEVTDDLQSLLVQIEMVASSEELLTDNTTFWYVTADVSFQGVTGLDTLISGSYINVQPDLEHRGNPSRFFVALNEAPELDKSTPGLHITLKTNTLGSINTNSPVSFKQIPVGHVSGVQYNVDDATVDISVFIKPEHAYLVKENSIFWNASGFEFTGSLTSGINIKTESVGSIISGGVAFDDPKFSTPLPSAKSGHEFTLHPDFQTAEMGHEITLKLDWDTGIDKGALIEYQGLTLGVIESFSKIDPTSRKITAIAKVSPRVVPYLTSDSQFYTVTPELDLGGVTNLRTLLKGSHLSLRPSLKGEPQTQFNVYAHKPAYDYDEPGLHIMLTASDVESLKIGTNIYYKKQPVGTVQAIENKTSEQVIVHIHIKEQYKQYVKSNTRFWNTSGVRIKAGIQGVDIKAHSLQSILAGGIAFDTHETVNAKSVNNGDLFPLLSSRKIAKQSLPLTLLVADAKGIKRSTRIIHRGNVIGSVHAIHHKQDHHELVVGLLPEFDYLLKESTKFWLVDPRLTLSGVTDTEAFFGGSYIAILAGKGPFKQRFHMYQKPPAKELHASGLQLTLMSENGASLVPGSPVTYKGISVGQIDSVDLSKNGDSTLITITIDETNQHLVNQFSRFYVSSGISLTTDLTSVSLQAESAETILRGGLSFYNPKEGAAPLTKEGEKFTLFSSRHKAKVAGQAISIKFTNIAGIKAGLSIKFHQQTIGSISYVDFINQEQGAIAYGYLTDYGKRFAVEGSSFYFDEASIGLTGNKHISSALQGGFIGVSPGKGKAKTHFIAANSAPATKALPFGLNLTLTANSLGSIRVGNPVLYKQVAVGSVIGIDLANNADKVNIYINITDRYTPLVTPESKFWNTSGFSLEAGLFSGVNVESESLESLMSGGIAFATPKRMSAEQLVLPTVFDLYQSVEPKWQTWSPRIPLAPQ